MIPYSLAHGSAMLQGRRILLIVSGGIADGYFDRRLGQNLFHMPVNQGNFTDPNVVWDAADLFDRERVLALGERFRRHTQVDDRVVLVGQEPAQFFIVEQDFPRLADVLLSQA